ncbi:hypothetical protein F511_35356 [Dorcoceras hygrometricum]|uniref:Uncharacterized protein n=1 Tax=Dorcoceras hygrometricum TaxID=472368 RepID=A0A2Z7AJW1_9LAMI|nr:hypothetical protein F511_35356 [Dorcoceras hygrometricum]
MVVSTIRGRNVEISEEMFATAFGLPTEGLIDVSDVPKDLVFDARSLFSESEVQTETPRSGDQNKSDHVDGGTRRRHRAAQDGGRSAARGRGRGRLSVMEARAERIQLAVGPQPLRLRNHNFGLAHRIMVKRLATSPHDPLGITDSACKNQLVMVSVQYGPFNTYIPIRSTTIGKSRVARDPIAMHTSWRSNSDIASVTSIGYPCMKASGESSTTKHRLLHASGPHPIPPPNDPNWASTLTVLKAMVAPGSRQAKGFANEISVVLRKVPGLELGESNPFPIHRVLTERTVHRFVHINEQIGMEKAVGSTPVKKTVKKPVSKKRSAASETEVAPIAKKKRTTKGKPAAMALEAVPLQTVEPTADVPAELPPMPKIKSRKRRLVLEQEDDLVVDEPVEESATGVQETSTDVPVSEDPPAADPDDIIEQILIQLDTASATKDDNTETWFDRTFDEEFASTEQEKQDSEEQIDFDVAKTVEIKKIRLGGSINIQEVQERDMYYASLPRISVHDKGKEPLVEDEPVKWNPARETVELICGYVEFLVRLRDQVMVDVVEFFHSFSLNKLPDSESLKTLKEKEKLMLEWAGTDSLETAVKRRLYILAKYLEMLLRKFLESHQKYLVPGQPWTATASQIIDLLSVSHSKSLGVLITHQKENGLPIEHPCTSTYLDTSIGSGAVLAQFFSQAKSKCWVRPMVKIDGLWTPIQGPELLRSSCKLSLFVNKRKVPESVVEEDFVPHGCVIEPFQYWGTALSRPETETHDIGNIKQL